MKRILTAAAALLVLTGCGFELDATPVRSTQTFPLTSTRLTITSGLGALRISQGSANQVVVTRWLRGKAANDNSWALKDGTLALTARCQLVFGDCGAEYAINVPPGVELVVEAGDDPVSVSSLSQRVAVTTTGGTIKVNGGSGQLRLLSKDGAIHAEGITSSEVRARTSDGEILLAFATPPTNVDALSREGRVITTVPDAPYKVTVSSKYGKATSDVKQTGDGRTIIAKSIDGNVRVSNR
ncbi:DUF4097 family beta strand repeat-containing protein [Nonomuraea sp. NPDC050556]|uniref:DUF4097 family beta strand repeat-containing protein n=1 Tax=Nonomuraea sp. NPDC050556 TaxID=3364369 RepID=UPI0037A731E9